MQLKLKYVDIESIRPDPSNPRLFGKEEVLELARLIHEFGFNVPVLLRADGQLIAGHLRTEAAKSLGMTKVPAFYAEHLSEAQQKAYVAAENKAAQLARFDPDKLPAYFQDLSALGYDVTLTGFRQEEVDYFLQSDPTYLDNIISDNAQAVEDQKANPEVPPMEVKNDVGLHRLQLVLFPDQKDDVQKAIALVKTRAKESGAEEPSVSDAVTIICRTFIEGVTK
jgi:ParB-like nuclease domain